MTYDDLEIIPYKLFLKIAGTDEVMLLTDDNSKTKEELSEIWKVLFTQHQEKHNTPESLKHFNVEKNISFLEGQRNVIIMACESLFFEYDQDLVDLLTNEYGYILSAENTEEYYNQITRIFKESSGILFKINQLKKQLPKANEKKEYSIDDVMASYAATLGIDFDYNAITYTKFYAIQKQVHLKMKQMELQKQQQQKQRSKQKR